MVVDDGGAVVSVAVRGELEVGDVEVVIQMVIRFPHAVGVEAVVIRPLLQLVIRGADIDFLIAFITFAPEVADHDAHVVVEQGGRSTFIQLFELLGGYAFALIQSAEAGHVLGIDSVPVGGIHVPEHVILVDSTPHSIELLRGCGVNHHFVGTEQLRLVVAASGGGHGHQKNGRQRDYGCMFHSRNHLAVK